MKHDYTLIATLLEPVQHIVIIQADNPDADSLGSSIALEAILEDLGKHPVMYCGVDMPTYLQYLPGWDRVTKELPKQFDASIIVDASTLSLLERLTASGELKWLTAKPCIVLDHHAAVENVIPFASVLINEPEKSSTGELIYAIARQLAWNIAEEANIGIMSAILGDTQGMSNQLAGPETYRVMADLIEQGGDRVHLEESRRAFSKMPLKIFRYKADLITRTKHFHHDKIAYVTIPQSEITTFSPLYNPAPLIQGDLLQTQDVAIAIVFKHYDDGRVTAAIRCNNGYPIGAELARAMGGGGHPYASGFKDTTGRPQDEITTECLQVASDLLTKLEKDSQDETIQYSFSTN